MKVLYIVTWYDNFKKSNKAGVFHKEQAISLKERGVDVALFFPFDDIDFDKIISTFDDNLLVYRYKNFLRNNFLFKIIKIIKFISNFRYIVYDFKPDILHAHVGRVAGFYTFLLSKIYKIPYIVSEHAPVEQLGINNVVTSYKNKLVYKNSRFNTCCSVYNYKLLSNKYKNIKFNVVYNSINVKKTSLLNKKFKKDESVNVCIVGSFYDKYIKGYQYLLPAIRMIKKDGYKITLHIVGGGEYLIYYKNLAKKLNVQDICIFYDYCDRDVTNTIISQMNFCISSSITESAGIFCEETMSFGIPLLVTKSGGADSICNNKTAYIVDRGSIKELYKGLVYMINNYNNFDNNYIREYANNNFDSEVITNKYIDIYNYVNKGNDKDEC